MRQRQTDRQTMTGGWWEERERVRERELQEYLIPLCFVVVVADRFYIALFSALEQTHCARMRFYVSD